MITIQGNKLIRIFDGERMQIECWGKNSLRVRITKCNDFTPDDWALLPPEQIFPDIRLGAVDIASAGKRVKANAVGEIVSSTAEIINGKIHLKILDNGKLLIQNNYGRVLLAEYEYDRHSMLGINSRELKTRAGNCFSASMKWNANPEEKLYGMGQYQNGVFNLKGSFLELAQRNSQASVPFVYSSLGYGFLWNNPAVGRASFGTNMTEWEAHATKQIDFWITAGDSPAEILAAYMEATGKPPIMPEHGLGFWQCKLRYQTQEELLNVAREYHRRGVPLDVIVIDFFHWPMEGTWAFDPVYWPDPASMVKELEEMGIKLVVSVWPTVCVHAPNYQEMRDKGYLVLSENGVKISMLVVDPVAFTDFTNPAAREYHWQQIKRNYVSYGITDFWLDVAEPEYTSYDYENYRYYIGSTAEVGNEYPAMYTKTFYDGLKAEGIDSVNLVRCAWAGSQRYGALVWSGDIPSTFESFKIQIVCGLQMAMAGIPWWTTDIGGFNDGHIDDPRFQELLIRWFQYGTFCPVMRLHGNRLPQKPGLSNEGGGQCGSGADNEIWSFGEKNYKIMKHYIEVRDRMRPYLSALYQKSSETGCPIMRPLFYNFPEDDKVWEIKDQFLLGDDILVAPITEYGQRKKNLYLPDGTKWLDAYNHIEYDGGQPILVDSPIDIIPVFVRADRRELVDLMQLN